MGTKTQQTATDDGDLASIIKDFTIDQLRYVAVRPYVGFDKEAAEKIGRSVTTVSKWKNKAAIDRAAAMVAAEGVLVTSVLLQRHLPQAAQEMIEQLGNRNVAVRHKAAVDILDRAMGKATQRIEATGKDGGPIETKDIDGLTDEERIVRIAALLKAQQDE